MFAQLLTESVTPPARLTPLTRRTEVDGFAKSMTEEALTERLPNVSVVPLSFRVPPFSTMLMPESLKLAPSVSVEPALSVIVPVPVSVPARVADPRSVKLPLLPRFRAPLLVKDPTDWLVPLRFRVAPEATVTAFPLKAPLTFVWSVPPLTATEPRNDGFAAERVRVPEPSLTRLLAEVPVKAPLMVTLLLPPTSRLLAPMPTAPERVSVPASDWTRLAPETVTGPLTVLFPEMFSNAPANPVPMLLMLKLFARVTLFCIWTFPPAADADRTGAEAAAIEHVDDVGRRGSPAVGVGAPEDGRPAAGRDERPGAGDDAAQRVGARGVEGQR
jgi:hypothetical protein